MTFLPIVVRELRVAARGRGLYRVRFWTAVAACAYGGYLMLIFHAMPVAGGGRMVFSSLTSLGLLYCALLARNTMDCVSEEKREGTLGLLFLTDLKGYDVVLGKLFANSIKSFYGLLATFPVLGCAFMLGGVTGLEFWRAMLALLNVFFFSHATGLFVSTLSRDRRRATAGTIVMLIVWFIGIPGIVALLQYWKYAKTAGLLELFNPAYSFQEAAAIGTRSSDYWTSLFVVQLNAWFFLALASLVMPRCWQDKPGKTNPRAGARFQQWCYGPPDVREALRLRLLDINPFLWLVSRNRLGSTAVWGVLGLVVCGLFWVVTGQGLRDSSPWFVTAILVNHTLLKFWIASESCYHLEEQRRSGALELLLSCTPLSPQDIIRGQWLALRRRFLGPIVAALAFDFLCTIIIGESGIGELVGFVLASMLLLVTDAFAIGSVGMWLAMSQKRLRTAAGQTIFRIVILPMLFLGLMMPLGAIQGFDFATVLIVWVVISIVVDFGFASVAEQKLSAEFRARAAVQQEETLGFFGQLGRFLGETTGRRGQNWDG